MSRSGARGRSPCKRGTGVVRLSLPEADELVIPTRDHMLLARVTMTKTGTRSVALAELPPDLVMAVASRSRPLLDIPSAGTFDVN